MENKELARRGPTTERVSCVGLEVVALEQSIREIDWGAYIEPQMQLMGYFIDMKRSLWL